MKRKALFMLILFSLLYSTPTLAMSEISVLWKIIALNAVVIIANILGFIEGHSA